MPAASSKAKHNRRSRSRNTTPSVSTIASADAPQLEPNPYTKLLGVAAQHHVSLSDMLTQDSSSQSSIPTAAHLNQTRAELKSHFMPSLRKTEEGLEQSMREIVKRRPEMARLQAEKDAEDRRKAKSSKKKDRERERDEDRPLALGAHGVARQDGQKEDSSSISSVASPNEANGKDEKAEGSSDDDSADDHQPTAAPKIAQFQTFGPDPSTFPDPTIYHIRELTDDIAEEEKKEILSVAEYPHSDLHDLTAGTPPDKDFSNTKPTNQTSASVFANYVDPYIRPLTEEDMAFLRERGDRVNPFIMPPRGARPYKDVWKEEDGGMVLDTSSEKLPPNEARGSIDQMNDEMAETDQISTGPVLARLISALRPESRGDGDSNANGDGMDVDGEPQANGDHPTTNGVESHSPSTHMPESAQAGWKNQSTTTVPRLDYPAMDERLLGELRHIGFVAEDQFPEFDKQTDDEVSARLRYLQTELRRQSIVNGARKARVLELAEERLAMQEYGTIADDLDGQINQAYLKRNRNMGKGKKGAKRPGAGPMAAASGVGKPGVGQPVRELLERKKAWNAMIGPVVNAGRASIPTQPIFDLDTMKKLEAKEQEMWDGGLEE